jgi:hypothetical protein
MRVFEMIKQTVLLLLMAATISCAQAAPRDDVNWINLEVVIRGDYFRAVQVAYEDYSIKLLKRAKDAAAPDGTGDKKLAEYLSHIEHFNIQVGAGHGRYNVWILARASEEFPVIFGGDALYIIDDRDFKVIEKHYGK